MEVTSENAFKIIDIELNLMFEFLYTKARIIYGPFGIISKTITMVLTLGVVLSFCMVDKQVYELKLDVSITFMVILGLLLSEIYSIIKVISSDRLYALFIERKSSFLYRLVSYMQSCQELGWLGFATEGCRWSATLSQFNILCFAVDKTWKMFSYNKKIEKLYEKIKQYFSIFYQPLGDGMRIWIHMYLKGKVEKLGEEGHLNATNKKPWLPAYGATKILYELSLDQLTWSTDEIEFSRSIVIWHIATEIQYYVGRKLFGEKDDILTNCEISRTLSNYLIYLLVRESNMLPIGVGDNYYAHTLLEARKFFEDQSSKIPSPNSKKFGERIGLRKNYEHEEREPFCCCHQQEKVHKNREEKSKSQEAPKIRKHESQGDLDTCRICHMLLQVPHESEMEPKLVEGGGNQSLLFHAVHLAQQLSKIEKEKRWEVIRDVWTEALLYSAYHSGGEVHAKQLSYGGEFLTHVWLLMAHFGVSKQIKTSTKTALKRMVQF